MESLVNTKEALTKLCAFLSAGASDTGKNDVVADLFSPKGVSTAASVEVEVAFLMAPPAHRVPLYFVVPNEVMSGTICVVTPPPQRSFKDKVLALSEEGDDVALRVKRVIDTTKLGAKIVDPVAVRAFSKSYDNFVLYGVVKYPKQLTGEFLGHQKLPVWVAKKGSFEQSLHNATKTVVVARRGQNAVTCRVGHTGLTVEQLEENVKTLVEKLTRHPQGAALGQILHIRVAGTNGEGKRAGLPIYSHVFHFPAVDEDGAPRKKAKTEAS